MLVPDVPSPTNQAGIPQPPAADPAPRYATVPLSGPPRDTSPRFGTPAADRTASHRTLYIVGGVAAGMLALFAAISVVWLVGRAIDGGLSESPLPQRGDDYAMARHSFRTRLTREGPSPQAGDPLRTPRGARSLTYTSGGLPLRAFVDEPRSRGGAPQPGVVFLHGGFAYGDEDWEMPQIYRDAGFVVMIPVLRGENGQPGKFTLFYDEVDDVVAAGEALAALPYVDADNVFVAGHSAGGTLAALAALASRRFRAAASLSGVMNVSVLVRQDRELRVFNPSDENELVMRSPESFAGSFKCPVRLYYGSDEPQLGKQAQRTAEKAREQGRDVTAHLMAGDHFTSAFPAMGDSVQFFNQHRRAASAPPAFADSVAFAPNMPPTLADRSPTAGSDWPEADMTADNEDRPGFRRSRRPEMPAFTPPGFPTPDAVRPGFGQPGSGPSGGFPPGTIPPDAGTEPTLPEDTNPSSGPIVIFQRLGYNGEGNERIAAIRALIGIRWVNLARVQVDSAAGEIVVGVRGSSVNTGEAKVRLEQAGFQIGFTRYLGAGR